MWSSDFEINPGEWFGEWLRSEIADNAVLEQNGFMPDRVRAAAEKLQRDRPPAQRYLVEVPSLDAFTAPCTASIVNRIKSSRLQDRAAELQRYAAEVLKVDARARGY